jgi:hypothetical protein
MGCCVRRDREMADLTHLVSLFLEARNSSEKALVAVI